MYYNNCYYTKILTITRKHSSRMHTTCLPTIYCLATTRYQYCEGAGIQGPMVYPPHGHTPRPDIPTP